MIIVGKMQEILGKVCKIVAMLCKVQQVTRNVQLLIVVIFTSLPNVLYNLGTSTPLTQNLVFRCNVRNQKIITKPTYLDLT